MKTFDSMLDLSRHFRTEQTCRKHLEQVRWGSKPICPHCNHNRIYRFKNNKTFKCASCKRKFTVTVGTIFENSNIPLTKWFMAIYLILNHKKGISSLQLGRDIGITQKSAWFVNHRLRELTRTKRSDALSGIVEVDETYIGGNQNNQHHKKRSKGTGMEYKTPVLGMMERGGKLMARKIKKADGKTIKPIVKQEISKDAILLTDGFGGYYGLGNYFTDHYIVNHRSGEYVRGLTHTNTIEGFWSHFKRSIFGIYHYISPKHTQRYCDASVFRYNTRELSGYDRFNLAISNCAGRLTYKELIGVRS